VVDPFDGLLHGPHAAGGDTEVKVGEVRDPEAVELGRKPREPDLANAQAHPAGFEPTVRKPGRREDDGDENEPDDDGQICSFSTTGSTETT
jgi:hypothetical protein